MAKKIVGAESADNPNHAFSITDDAAFGRAIETEQKYRHEPAAIRISAIVMALLLNVVPTKVRLIEIDDSPNEGDEE